MPTRVQWTKERINELHTFLTRWKKGDGYKRGAMEAAAKHFNVTRQTIYNTLKEYPKPIVRESAKSGLIPQYIEDFMSESIVQDFVKSKERVTKGSGYISVGVKAWKILGKKHPLNWSEQDFELLWGHENFRDPETGLISNNNAVALRQWMKHLKFYDAVESDRFTTRGLKRQVGRKLTHWIKTEDEFKAVIDEIEYPDTLIMFNTGIQCGSRHSSIKRTTPQDISYATNSIMMHEPKVKQQIERVFLKETLDLLRLYTIDQGFKGSDRIFPRSLTTINEDLRQAGLKAGITFDLTTHVAMKHTFVSFASNHGVSLEVVSKQTGTDPSTLMQFYAGISKGKIRHELLGEKYEEPDFHETMRRLQAYVAQRYQQIKGRKHNKAKKAAASKQFQKRVIPWKAMQGVVDSPKSNPARVSSFKEALQLHSEGLTDAEVRHKMGWRE
jgi:hypothetical protein